MAQVIIYSTPTCGYCHVAKEFFKRHNVDFVEKDVAADLEARQEMLTKSQQMGVPVIDVEGQIMVGYNEGKLRELLGIAVA